MGGVGQLQYVVEVLYVHTCGIVYVIHGHITAKLKESTVIMMLSNGINIIHMHILSTQEVPCAYRYMHAYIPQVRICSGTDVVSTRVM